MRMVTGAIDTDMLSYCLYLLAKEELDRPYEAPFTATMDSPEEQRALDGVRAFVQEGRATAFDLFVQQLCLLSPEEARMFEGYLSQDLTTLLLIDLGRRPVEPHILNIVRLSPDNPLRVRGWTDESMLIEIPHHVAITSNHLWELLQYRDSWRPVHKRGPHPRTPDTPRKPRRQPHDAEARRAWAFVQEHPGAPPDTIARFLWPKAPMTSEAQRRKQRAKARRRVARGRVLAHKVTTPTRQKKSAPPKKRGTT
jgi:hypothetical protein